MPDGAYFNWGAPRARSGSEDEGWSDAEGLLQLGGLPPGAFTLSAEAPGKEPKLVEVVIVSGVSTDIGDIVLPDAEGGITVEITGKKDGVEYSVVVFQPSGGAVLPFLPIHGDTCEVRNLPLRRYRVTVTGKKGGSLVGEDVTLTQEQRKQSIRIDVSSVVPD